MSVTRFGLIAGSAAIVLASVTAAAGGGVDAAGELTTDQEVYTFVCDGGPSRPLGTLSGALPGEVIDFTSPEEGGLLSGTANGNGELGLIWQCPTWQSTWTWHVNAVGRTSGRTGSFVVNGQDATGGGGGGGGFCAPKPAGDVAAPGSPAYPAARQPVSSYAGLFGDIFKVTAGLQFLGRVGGSEARRLAEVYLGPEENDEQTIHLGDLLWEERASWAALEGQLQDAAQVALNNAVATPSDTCQVFVLNTTWIGLSADATNKWRYAIGDYNVTVRGDVWIGKADPVTGQREVQLRYKVFFSDVYDFESNAGTFAARTITNAFLRLWDHGRADEFLITGTGVNTRTFTYEAASADFSGIGLNW